MRKVLIITLLLVPVAGVAEEAGVAQPQWPWDDASAERGEHEAGDPEQGEHRAQAAAAGEWRGHVAAMIEEMEREMGEAPPDAAKVMKQTLALRQKMLEAIDAKIAAHKAGDWDRAQEAAKRIEACERELAFVDLDIDEARTLAEVQEIAKANDLGEAVEPLLDEIRETFAQAREIREAIQKLHQREALIHRRLELIQRRLELAVLERETQRLEKELATE